MTELVFALLMTSFQQTDLLARALSRKLLFIVLYRTEQRLLFSRRFYPWQPQAHSDAGH